MLVHPQFNPIAVSLGPVAVHWYGITYLVAFGMFLWLANLRVRRPWYVEAGWTRRDVEDLLFWGVLGTVIGGRLGYVLFYKPGHYAANPLECYNSNRPEAMPASPIQQRRAHAIRRPRDRQ
ncbi:MAG: prolipoprotein diacylglyceryl transferase [Burkholderiales bacterium]|nr:prolipoprotein diacylglyceryl transferase [Burkholderiales bacterium]